MISTDHQSYGGSVMTERLVGAALKLISYALVDIALVIEWQKYASLFPN